MKLHIELDKKDIARLMLGLENIDPAKHGKAIVKGLKLAALDVEAGLKLKISGNPLKTRTGRLRNSIETKLMTIPGGVLARVGSGVRRGSKVKYAGIHEHGGTIRPKKAKYLTIPLAAALTASGAPRGKARDFDNTYVRKTSSGELMIFQGRGRGESIPLFLLKKSVKIPARHYMGKTVKEHRTKVTDIASRTIDREVFS